MRKNCQKKTVKKAAKSDTVSYRLNCPKSANGLSHFVMYGDVDRKKALL